MSKTTDRVQGMALNVTDEHKSQTASVLARLAERYAQEQPGALVDGFAFTVRVGAEAYDATGRTLARGHRVVAALVREQAPSVKGAACGPFAAGLLDAARRLGWSEDDNGPAIPRHPVPGPRESEESGRVPAPRRGEKPSQAPAVRQIRHALDAVARMSPGRRRVLQAAAKEYLTQVERRILPMGYDQPIVTEAGNRADAFRMRRGATFAGMLGIACRPSDPNLPVTARMVLDWIEAPVRHLETVAQSSGQPLLTAVMHVALPGSGVAR